MKSLVTAKILSIIFISLSTFNLWAVEVLKVQGTVEVKKGKSFKPVKTGDILAKNAHVRTDKKSLAILKLSNGTTLKLNPVSKLKLKDGKAAEVKLDIGSLFAKFKGKPGATLNVKTSGAVAGVRGTEFFTSYGSKGKEKDVWLCVNEGVVDVKNLKTGSSVKVKEGEGIGIQEGKETSKPKPLAWTRKLNWSMDPTSKDLENKVDIESAYTDLLDQDYD